MGIVPFALGKTEELIQMAFELYEQRVDRVTMDLRFILMTLNTVASYFGDPVMTVAQVDKVVDDGDKLDPPKSGQPFMAAVAVRGGRAPVRQLSRARTALRQLRLGLRWSTLRSVAILPCCGIRRPRLR